MIPCLALARAKAAFEGNTFPNLIPRNKIFMLIHWLGLLVTWEAPIKAQMVRRGRAETSRAVPELPAASGRQGGLFQTEDAGLHDNNIHIHTRGICESIISVVDTRHFALRYYLIVIIQRLYYTIKMYRM